GANYFSASPYLDLNYDPFPFLSLYARFKPEMHPADYTQLMPGKFLAASATLKPASESVDLKTGVNLNVFDVFGDVYYGHYNIKNNIYIDEAGSTRAFTLYNNDIEYNYSGVSAEVMRSGPFTVTLGYEYKNLIKSSTGKTTYLPNNELDLKLKYALNEWTFRADTGLLSGFMGTLAEKALAYALLNLGVSWKLNGNFTVEGHINNVLNNNYYLLYYYKAKLLNLGLGITFVF
ncbi:MAG: TonB-dependent receptor, partial [Spirochaetia bacterium]|nr:TonB-dependent receptor [Spirochaetia bacterium]